MSRIDPLNDAETRALMRALWRDAAARCMLLRPRPDHGLQCLSISPAMRASLGLAGSEIADVDLGHLLSAAGRQQLDDVIRQAEPFGHSGALVLQLPLAQGLARTAIDVRLSSMPETGGLILLSMTDSSSEPLPRVLADIDLQLPGFVYDMELLPGGGFRFRFVSRGVEVLLGLAPDEMTVDAARLLDRFDADDRDAFLALVTNQADDLKPANACFRMHHPGHGGSAWIEFRDRVRQLPDGTVRRVGYASDVTLRMELQTRQRQLAHYDPVTALPNRRLFLELLQHALELAERERQAVPLLVLDLDHFASVNDSYGREAVDELLREAARRMVTALRASDVIGRVGPDDFAVLLPTTESRSAAILVANKLLAALQEPMRLSAAGTVHLSASIGIAWFPDDATGLTELLRRAGVARDRAGRVRDTVVCYNDKGLDH